MKTTDLLDENELEQAQIMAAMSALAYQPGEAAAQGVKAFGMRLEALIDQPSTGTQGFCAQGMDFACIAFRGTEVQRLEDIIVDLLAWPVAYGSGKVHLGFRKAFASVEDQVLEQLKKFQALELPVYFTGHSLGGALAAMGAAFALDHNITVGGLFTFGQPRVCNAAFEKQYVERLQDRYYRFTNGQDLVPQVPIYFMGYRHFGMNSYRFNEKGDLTKESSRWKGYLVKTLGVLAWGAARSPEIREYLTKLFSKEPQDPDTLRPLAKEAVKAFFNISNRDIVSHHNMQTYLKNLQSLTAAPRLAAPAVPAVKEEVTP